MITPMPAISVIIPAFNEEFYLPETLGAIARSAAALKSKTGASCEVIVVDNDSTDSTAELSRALGANVVAEKEHNVARVRNRGARSAIGDILVFVDADTLIPEDLLTRVHEIMVAHARAGGAVDTDYRPKKRIIRAYLGFWRGIGAVFGMAQGATQFCRRDVFVKLNGYDESLFMGEDVDFYARLRRYARSAGREVLFVDDLRVTPSCRRFDQWPLWRTLVWTNPLVIAPLRRVKWAWPSWYDAPLR